MLSAFARTEFSKLKQSLLFFFFFLLLFLVYDTLEEVSYPTRKSTALLNQPRVLF